MTVITTNRALRYLYMELKNFTPSLTLRLLKTIYMLQGDMETLVAFVVFCAHIDKSSRIERMIDGIPTNHTYLIVDFINLKETR